ncbi:MAG: rhomboid family intramembrane serine protease [Planctomycetes bacterium]|nr:rhomboid family intramembrane serine protease [Planctomycetota bacterium]
MESDQSAQPAPQEPPKSFVRPDTETVRPAGANQAGGSDSIFSDELLQALAEEPLRPAPVVESVDARSVASFDRALRELTPRVWCARLLLLTIVVMFILPVSRGVSAFSPTGPDLIAWGANFGPKTLSGEWWRLGTCTLLHFGFVHLLFNALALMGIGRLIELMLGQVGFVIACVICGVAGSVGSLLWNPTAVSVGISGVVFGLFGVMLGFLPRCRGTVPDDVFQRLKKTGLSFVGYNLAMGLAIQQIDHFAHLGGLIGGLLVGFVAGGPLDRTLVAARLKTNLKLMAVGGLLLGTGVSLLPAAPRDPFVEEAALIAEEARITERYNRLIQESQAGDMTEDQLASVLENELLVDFRKLREGWKSMKNVRGSQADLLERLDRCLKLRQESWECLVRAIREPDHSDFWMEEHRRNSTKADQAAQDLAAKTKERK